MVPIVKCSTFKNGQGNRISVHTRLIDFFAICSVMQFLVFVCYGVYISVKPLLTLANIIRNGEIFYQNG